MILKILSVLLAVTLPISASAEQGFNLKLDLESKISEKVGKVLAPVDSDAQVFVKVNLKEITTVLPSAGLQMNSFLAVTDNVQISGIGVDRIEVKVVSKLDPIPDPIKQLIEHEASLPKVKMSFQYQKLDESILQAIAHRDDAKKSTILNDHEQVRALYLLTAVLSVVLLLSVMVVRAGFKKEVAGISKSMAELAKAAPAASNSASADQQFKEIQALPTARAPKLDDGISSIPAFQLDSLIALISDCYWCENDGYAVWLWQKMTPTQRVELIKKWPVAQVYLQSVTSPAKAESFHDHPYYLRPLPIWNIAQDGLAQWLNGNPTAWHFLSPMRQEKLPMPLMQKFNLSSSPRPKEAPLLPSGESTFRTLSPTFAVADISLEDELSIFKDSAKIPIWARQKIQSLVWLALLPEKSKREILGKISAQQLAQAWVGPKEILAHLESQLDERKLKLLRDYQQKVKADRNSTILQFIVQESLTAMQTPANPQDGKTKQAA